MFFGNHVDGWYIYRWFNFIDNKLIIITFCGILLSGILQKAISRWHRILYDEDNNFLLENILQIVLFGICIMLLINDTYNPFIYFKF